MQGIKWLNLLKTYTRQWTTDWLVCFSAPDQVIKKTPIFFFYSPPPPGSGISLGLMDRPTEMVHLSKFKFNEDTKKKKRPKSDLKKRNWIFVFLSYLH